MPDIEVILAKARRRTMSAAEAEEQRRSFAHGNAALANPRVTRATIDAAAEAIAREEVRTVAMCEPVPRTGGKG